MKNVLGGIVSACIILAFVPLGSVIIAILGIAISLAFACTLAAIVYCAATGETVSAVEYERTVERTDEDGRTTRRVFRSVNGKTEMTEEVVE